MPAVTMVQQIVSDKSTNYINTAQSHITSDSAFKVLMTATQQTV